MSMSENNNSFYKNIFMRGVFIWGLATIFYFFDNLLNVAPGAMKPELSEAFNLSASKLGILSSCYLWPYGIMQIPAGLLIDKYGPRRLFALSSLSCAFGSILFGLADTLLLAMLGRIFIGIGASFAVVGTSKIASIWFPANKFALFMGFMVAVGMLGAAFGLATVSKIISALGWRESMYLGGFCAVILSIVLWIIIRDYPAGFKSKTKSNNKEIEIIPAMLEVIKCKQAWFASIFAGLMFVPTLAFGALWGTPYLVEAHGFSRESAGFLAALVFVGWVLGGPLYGWISDKTCKRNPSMYFANITTLVLSVIIIYAQNLSFGLLGTLMFLLGACSSGFVLAFAVTKENNRIETSATTIGFVNMINTFSVALFQWLIGFILDLTTAGSVTSKMIGEKTFSLENYQTSLLLLPVCLLVSLFMLINIKETNCKSKY